MAPKILQAIGNFFNRNKGVESVMEEPSVMPVEAVEDPTGWMLASEIAQILLLHTHEIKMMFMFGYALLHGMCR